MNKYEKLIENLNELYTYLKIISIENYKNSEMTTEYFNLKDKILEIEEQIPKNLFIIPSKPKYKKTSLIDEIVFESRCKFEELYLSPFKIELSNFHLINYCKNMSNIVNDICIKKGIISKRILMHACFLNNDELYNGGNYHYFNIIIVDNKKYLIDLTYRQFFTLVKNSLNRIGIPYLASPLPGIFMTLNKRRLNLACKLLENGYIELTDENGKDYFDAFTLSYRNGLYYEKTMDFSYTTPYKLDDYINFLKGKDKLTKYEDITTLGYQKVPLKKLLKF